MNNILKSLSIVLMVSAVPLGFGVETLPVQAQAVDPAVAQILGFQDMLIAAMKSGGTVQSRYTRLKPAIQKAFNLSAMTEKVVGLKWASLSAAEQKSLTDAFTRMTIASYAKNFDSYDGEKFLVEPKPFVRGAGKYVKSTLKPTSGDSHVFLYAMLQSGGEWKVTDILLEGRISQMGATRDDYAATLASGGPAALAKRINALADQMLG